CCGGTGRPSFRAGGGWPRPYRPGPGRCRPLPGTAPPVSNGPGRYPAPGAEPPCSRRWLGRCRPPAATPAPGWWRHARCSGGGAVAQDLGIIADGEQVVIPAAVGLAALQGGREMIRIPLEYPVEVGDGLVILPPAGAEEAALVECFVVLRGQGQGPAQVGEG